MRKIIYTTVGVFLFFTFTTSTHAAILQGFGGRVTAVTPCLCSGTLLIFFAPLYPQPLLPLFGALTYMPGQTILKPWFRIGVPSTWELGQFTPGVQMCLQPGTPCIIVPSNGHMFLVGTS